MRTNRLIPLLIALILAALILWAILNSVTVILFEDDSWIIGRMVGPGAWDVWASGCLPGGLCQ